MSGLKLGALESDKPVKVTVELPAAVHRDLVAYAEVLAAETGQAHDPTKLIAPMLERFMATDREFAKRPFRKGLSGRCLRDSSRLSRPSWSDHVDPDHPREA